MLYKIGKYKITSQASPMVKKNNFDKNMEIGIRYRKCGCRLVTIMFYNRRS